MASINGRGFNVEAFGLKRTAAARWAASAADTMTLLHDRVKRHYRELAPVYSNRSNRTCQAAYERLTTRFLRGRGRLLEIGAGASLLLDILHGTTAVACDLSTEMLRSRPESSRSHRVAAVAERLPFADSQFDGVVAVNVLEHVTNIELVLSEVCRVLAPRGTFVAVTPNGNWEFWLDLAEKWKLKVPEGPHSFLTTDDLRRSVGYRFDVVEHRTFLMLPVGGPRVASLIDGLVPCSALGWGFFQYLVGKKP
jgi:SAM-dependent methyltransferase